MKRKRIMLIGPESNEKNIISNLLNNSNEKITKTPNIIYRTNTIDIPGSYIESPWRHINIISTQQDAYLVLFICDARLKKRIYPPNFAKSFRMKVIGLILSEKGENSKLAYNELIDANVDEIYDVFIDDEKLMKKLCDIILKNGG